MHRLERAGSTCSPGIEGSRSGGLLAATWAAMVQPRPRRATAAMPRQIFETACAMQDAVRSHPRAAHRSAIRRSCFSFTSDDFDIYHVNDFMRTRGWRFNGQQYPNAIHMAVTRPQTQPGVAEHLRNRPRRCRLPTRTRAQDEAPRLGRRLRRRRRRHDRRSRRFHQDDDGADSRYVSEPATGALKTTFTAEYAETQRWLSSIPTSPRLRVSAVKDLVLAVDLGTGGPKVGLVSLTGRIAWQDHLAVATRHLPGGGAVQDAEEWWRLVADASRRALASGAVAPGVGRGGELHGTVGEHRAGGRGWAAGRRTA